MVGRKAARREVAHALEGLALRVLVMKCCIVCRIDALRGMHIADVTTNMINDQRPPLSAC